MNWLFIGGGLLSGLGFLAMLFVSIRGGMRGRFPIVITSRGISVRDFGALRRIVFDPEQPMNRWIVLGALLATVAGLVLMGVSGR